MHPIIRDIPHTQHICSQSMAAKWTRLSAGDFVDALQSRAGVVHVLPQLASIKAQIIMRGVVYSEQCKQHCTPDLVRADGPKRATMVHSTRV